MSAIPRALLEWYDANARALPWRVGPRERRAGVRPDPYRVWLSEIMLQQTTVATVRPRFDAFLARWPTVEAMAAAPIDDLMSEWAGLGYYARARNLHKCAVAIAARGEFPKTEDELLQLPGVGQYTAAAIAAIAFDESAVVIDGNIERVAARLLAIETPLPKARSEIRKALGAVWPKKRSGDFAQGLMDLGAGVCTPRGPKCGTCPLSAYCAAYAKGIAESLPVKAKRGEKPARRGVAYALFNAKGEILFERRPDRGLLGGMLCLPCTEWSELSASGKKKELNGKANAEASHSPAPPASLSLEGEGNGWRLAGTIRHTFTHFHLELDVMFAKAPKSFRRSADQQWIAPDEARLPTVMRKAVDRARGEERNPPLPFAGMG